MTTHGYALNVDLDPAPFTDWITACGLEDAAFTTVARELGRPVSVDEVVPHAVAALEAVFDLELEPLTLEHVLRPARCGCSVTPMLNKLRAWFGQGRRRARGRGGHA